MAQPNSTNTPKKIFLIDNVIIGNNHLVINSSMIRIAENLIPDHSPKISFFGEKRHLSVLKGLASDSEVRQVHFRPIDVINPKRGWIPKVLSWTLKLLLDFFWLGKIIRLAHRKDIEYVIFTTIIPINLLLFVSIFNRKSELKFMVLLHGDIEYIFKERPSRSERIKAYLLKSAFRRSRNNIKYVVLSDHIKGSLINSYSLKESQVFSVDHPIINVNTKAMSKKRYLQFSHLGVANGRKNSGLIFPLAKSLASLVLDGKARFSIIGRLDIPGINITDSIVEIEAKSNEPIDNIKYKSLIEEADYSLIFMSEKEYVFRISGSLLDSLQFKIPIIALKHPAILELFSKGGDIGFVCDNLDEMKLVIKEICKPNSAYAERYEGQVNNLEQLSNQFSAKSATLKFQDSIQGWNV